jgi:hypothetical protein
LFWQDRWLFGKSIGDLPPTLSALIPTRIANKRSIAEALNNWRWVSDMHGTVTVQVILELMSLCELLAEVSLQSGVPDKHIWRLSSSGTYSAKSTYNAMFQGSIPFSPWERIWKSWAPNKCCFFLWLVAHNRCWTADRLARHNLPHSDRCPLCDQERKSSTTYLSPASFLTNSDVFYCSELALQGCLLNPLKHPLMNGGEG